MHESIIARLKEIIKARETAPAGEQHEHEAAYYRVRSEYIHSHAGIPLHFSREQRVEVFNARDEALKAAGFSTHLT